MIKNPIFLLEGETRRIIPFIHFLFQIEIQNCYLVNGTFPCISSILFWCPFMVDWRRHWMPIHLRLFSIYSTRYDRHLSCVELLINSSVSITLYGIYAVPTTREELTRGDLDSASDPWRLKSRIELLVDPKRPLYVHLYLLVHILFS